MVANPSPFPKMFVKLDHKNIPLTLKLNIRNLHSTTTWIYECCISLCFPCVFFRFLDLYTVFCFFEIKHHWRSALVSLVKHLRLDCLLLSWAQLQPQLRIFPSSSNKLNHPNELILSAKVSWGVSIGSLCYQPKPL